jgi:hypothetical protein
MPSFHSRNVRNDHFVLCLPVSLSMNFCDYLLVNVLHLHPLFNILLVQKVVRASMALLRVGLMMSRQAIVERG